MKKIIAAFLVSVAVVNISMPVFAYDDQTACQWSGTNECSSIPHSIASNSGEDNNSDDQ